VVPFAELQQISLFDVVLPTRDGVSIRKRCVSRPTEHQTILLQRLRLQIPAQIEFAERNGTPAAEDLHAAVRLSP
jgi:hypothetical protein